MKTTSRRKTIYTIGGENPKELSEGLKIIANQGKNVFSGLGAFSGPMQMITLAKKNGFKIDKGAVISKGICPTIYEEIALGTARESSEGTMDLQQSIYNIIAQDWKPSLQYLTDKEIYFLMDVYWASTVLYAEKVGMEKNKMTKKKKPQILQGEKVINKIKELESEIESFKKDIEVDKSDFSNESLTKRESLILDILQAEPSPDERSAYWDIRGVLNRMESNINFIQNEKGSYTEEDYLEILNGMLQEVKENHKWINEFLKGNFLTYTGSIWYLIMDDLQKIKAYPRA